MNLSGASHALKGKLRDLCDILYKESAFIPFQSRSRMKTVYFYFQRIEFDETEKIKLKKLEKAFPSTFIQLHYSQNL